MNESYMKYLELIMDNITKALTKAYELHKHQLRKCSNAPYFTHILDVASILLREPLATEDIVIAGILHDTLEDTDYTPEELGADFGANILDLVMFASEPLKINMKPNMDMRSTWKERKQYTIDICKNATDKQLLIVLADKLANLDSMITEYHIHGESFWSHFNAPKEEIIWSYEQFNSIFSSKLTDTVTIILFNQHFLDGELAL